MTCSCIYVGGYDDPYHYHKRMIRRPHEIKCTECGRLIPPLELHEWVDTNFGTYRTCKDCLSIREAMFCDGWIFRYVWGDVADYIIEGGDISSDCLAKLTPTARARVCEMIDEYWEDE